MEASTQEQVSLPNLPERYELKITDQEKTGVRLFKLTDKETSITIYFVEFNKDVDVHAGIAFAGARTSRSNKTFEEIFAQIYKAVKEGKYTPGAKLADIFTGEFEGYGHASVGDLSPVMLRIEGIPIFEAFNFFNSTSVGGGQELSTRYVDINEFQITPLENLINMSKLSHTEISSLQEMWNNIQEYCAKKYNQWFDLIEDRLRTYLTSDGQPLSESTLKARTLDIARMFLPSGAATVVTMLTSVRSTIDMIAQLHEDGSYHSEAIANQLFTTLNLQSYEGSSDIQANLGGLTKYSEGKFTIKKNLEELREFLSALPQFNELMSETMNLINLSNGQPTSVKRLNFENLEDPGILIAMQYILVLYPDLSEEKILELLNNLPTELQEEIGRIIFKGHHHHNLLRNMGDIRGVLFVIESAMAYIRDINRHRALGRFVPMIENRDFRSILDSGFNQNYQIKNMEPLKDLQEAWNEDFAELYRKLSEIWSFVIEKFGDRYDTSFLMNLIPLGHQTKIHLSGPITQLIYLISLRIAPGGDFGYRRIAEELLILLRENPFVRKALEGIELPDPNSIEQNKNRR